MPTVDILLCWHLYLELTKGNYMQLDKYNLDNLLTNKYLVVVSGELTDSDRKVILRGLQLYNKKSCYVGESHIEAFYCQELSKGVKSIYGIDKDTSVLFFKNGFLEYKLQGHGDLLRGSEDLFGIIVENLGIILG
jgi:hypothetical protein